MDVPKKEWTPDQQRTAEAALRCVRGTRQFAAKQ
jgi:hypothetical protein